MRTIQRTAVSVLCSLAFLAAGCASQQPPTPQPPAEAPPTPDQAGEVHESTGSRGAQSSTADESTRSPEPTGGSEDTSQQPIPAQETEAGSNAPSTPDAEEPGTSNPQGQLADFQTGEGNRAEASPPGLPSTANAGEVGTRGTADSSGRSEADGQPTVLLPPGAPTADERAADIEGELDRALEDFDGLLLDEQERLDEQATTQAGGGGSGGAPGSTQGGAAGGEGTGDGAMPPGGTQSGEDGSGQTGGAPNKPSTGGSTGGGVGAGGPGGSETEDRVPTDVGDGSDDDIIARQLREAAMSEDDPELRERLWEEYRAYRASVNSGSGADG